MRTFATLYLLKRIYLDFDDAFYLNKLITCHAKVLHEVA
jgi:hypothetical protein